MAVVYIIDSSSLIDLMDCNPIDIYPSVWKRLIDLHLEDRLYSHIEVYLEIESQDDELKKWAKEQKNKYPNLFRSYSTAQQKYLADILKNFEAFVKINGNTYKDADPWLVALALEIRKTPTIFGPNEPIIVTEEILKGNKVKIPYVSNHYGIKCLKIFDVFRHEGWRF
ncbi:protein of unknown function {DUF4411} [Geoglobus ahangari]|uniref:DUF4411 family protein n=1 Tax=Geoglobus ahangari TaxID=113653 RepID=A0A0F7DBF0_9EURY|nr:DUF4411 family protein [Geoglobus ahangari]AKG90976.1 protein of unknown function {DUF4411} [Geoglobus ahangari]